MNLDPAIQYVKHGHYASKIWGFRGTENVFLAYLPLCQWVYMLAVYLFPFTLFYTRLLWFIGLISIAVVWFKYCKKLLPLSYWPYMCLLLFLFDEGFSRTARTYRVELWIVLLEIVFFYFVNFRKQLVSAAICLALLALAHPAVWALVGVGGIYLYYKVIEMKKQSYSLFYWINNPFNHRQI